MIVLLAAAPVPAFAESADAPSAVEAPTRAHGSEGGPAVSAAPPPESLRGVIGSPRLRASPSGIVPMGLVGSSPAALPPVGARGPDHPGDDLDRWGTEPSISDADFDFAALPGRLASERLRPIWREGLELERRGVFLESAARYERIVSAVPEESYTYWRIARNHWRHGESLPVDDKEGRILHFELAEAWAARGISIDAECAPCMLWKFVSMGRQATTRGLMSAVGDVGEMDRLLTRGIALEPDHADNAGNATLGNLYYSGSVFYRVIPDWWWLKLFIGVRGDKERSLEYARRAVEISGMRVDYRVELGAVLLCIGTEEGRPEALFEGMSVLREARRLDDFLGTDSLDKAHAALMLEAPDKACGYSRDGFIDLDSLEAAARTRR